MWLKDQQNIELRIEIKGKNVSLPKCSSREDQNFHCLKQNNNKKWGTE